MASRYLMHARPVPGRRNKRKAVIPLLLMPTQVSGLFAALYDLRPCVDTLKPELSG